MKLSCPQAILRRVSMIPHLPYTFFICRQDWWKYYRSVGSPPANIRSGNNGFHAPRAIPSLIEFLASALESAHFCWKRTDAVSTAGWKRWIAETRTRGRARDGKEVHSSRLLCSQFHEPASALLTPKLFAWFLFDSAPLW